LEQEKLIRIIAALLFVAGRPLEVDQLAQIAEVEEPRVRESLEALEKVFEGRGINLIKVAHGYQLVTDPECAEFVNRFLDAPRETYLSGPSLETLAIIAYKQPITRAEIEQIRGVNSDSPVETLMRRNLIEDKGKSDAVGRPVLYGTTEEFLKHFGLQDLSGLPALPEGEMLTELLRKGEVLLPQEQPDFGSGHGLNQT
jgi:segregation and condensation protein B